MILHIPVNFLHVHCVYKNVLIETPVIHRAVPLLFTCMRAEASPAYANTVGTLQLLAAKLGYTGVHIQCASMDHSFAIMNGAKERESEIRIVDCSVHVKRGMRKNLSRLIDTDLIDDFIKDVKVIVYIYVLLLYTNIHMQRLAKMTDQNHFHYCKAAMLAGWRKQEEEAFTDWFEEIYCDEAWGGGTFNVGASGLPGVTNHQQVIESFFKSLKGVMYPKATVSFFFENCIPRLLQHVRLHYSHSFVLRECLDQRRRVKDGHLHREILSKAEAILQDPTKNLKKVKVGGEWVWFVNSCRELYNADKPQTAITKARIDAYLSAPGRVTSFQSTLHRYTSMYRVDVTYSEDSHGKVTALTCGCETFWINGSHCPHTLNVWNALGVINLKHMLGNLLPVRKRGRPTNAKKALQREDNLDVMSLRPGDWKKAAIRHPEYLNGFVIDWRKKPHTHKIVWNVVYPDAP